jgi:hypothetical protein
MNFVLHTLIIKDVDGKRAILKIENGLINIFVHGILKGEYWLQSSECFVSRSDKGIYYLQILDKEVYHWWIGSAYQRNLRVIMS